MILVSKCLLSNKCNELNKNTPFSYSVVCVAKKITNCVFNGFKLIFFIITRSHEGNYYKLTGHLFSEINVSKEEISIHSLYKAISQSHSKPDSFLREIKSMALGLKNKNYRCILSQAQDVALKYHAPSSIANFLIAELNKVANDKSQNTHFIPTLDNHYGKLVTAVYTLSGVLMAGAFCAALYYGYSSGIIGRVFSSLSNSPAMSPVASTEPMGSSITPSTALGLAEPQSLVPNYSIGRMFSNLSNSSGMPVTLFEDANSSALAFSRDLPIISSTLVQPHTSYERILPVKPEIFHRISLSAYLGTKIFTHGAITLIATGALIGLRNCLKGSQAKNQKPQTRKLQQTCHLQTKERKQVKEKIQQKVVSTLSAVPLQAPLGAAVGAARTKVERNVSEITPLPTSQSLTVTLLQAPPSSAVDVPTTTTTASSLSGSLRLKGSLEEMHRPEICQQINLTQAVLHDYLEPNECNPQDMKTHFLKVENAKNGSCVTTGTERAVFDLLLGDFQYVINVDIEPKVKAYIDFLILLVRISENREEFCSFAQATDIENLRTTVLQRILLSDMPQFMKTYYSDNFETYSKVFYSTGKQWTNDELFKEVNYYRNDDLFAKFKKYAQEGRFISVCGDINDLKAFENVVAIDTSNIYFYTFIHPSLSGSSQHPLIIWTCPKSQISVKKMLWSFYSYRFRPEEEPTPEQMKPLVKKWFLEVPENGLRDSLYEVIMDDSRMPCPILDPNTRDFWLSKLHGSYKYNGKEGPDMKPPCSYSFEMLRLLQSKVDRIKK